MKQNIFVVLIILGFIAIGCTGKYQGSEDKVFIDTATGLS
jgi:hypothetical protein